MEHEGYPPVDRHFCNLPAIFACPSRARSNRPQQQTACPAIPPETRRGSRTRHRFVSQRTAEPQTGRRPSLSASAGWRHDTWPGEAHLGAEPRRRSLSSWSLHPFLAAPPPPPPPPLPPPPLPSRSSTLPTGSAPAPGGSVQIRHSKR